MTNDLRADLTVFTGDLISEMGDPLDAAIRELIRTAASRGAFSTAWGTTKNILVAANAAASGGFSGPDLTSSRGYSGSSRRRRC